MILNIKCAFGKGGLEAEQVALKTPYHPQDLAYSASHPMLKATGHLCLVPLTAPWLAFPAHTRLSSHILCSVVSFLLTFEC